MRRNLLAVVFFSFCFMIFAEKPLPPGCTGADACIGLRPLTDQERVFLYNNTWEAINRLLQCPFIKEAEKKIIREGKRNYKLWYNKYPPGSTICGETRPYGFYQPLYINNNYRENYNELHCCCKVPLWQTIGHELLHIYGIAPQAYGSDDTELSECKAGWLEDKCLGTVPDCCEYNYQNCCGNKYFEDWKKDREN